MYLLPAFTQSPQLNRVYNSDALEFLKSISSSSVDLVVTSPPYNLRNSSGNGLKAKNDKGLWTNQPMRNGYDLHRDDMPHDEYVDWQRSILVECMRILKPAGAVFYNHKWRVQNGLLQDRADIVSGFPVRQIIIWNREGGINFNDGYLLPSYEVIYLIAKPDFKLTPGGNAYKDVWNIRPSENKDHPNAFPVEIPRRAIEISGAQVVVDPFCGIGTTGIAARMLNRNYLLSDHSLNYVEIARRELAMDYTIPMFDVLPMSDKVAS